ncbi:MAG: DUF3006 domain-containing protein [Patescibacteria group bacterium]
MINDFDKINNSFITAAIDRLEGDKAVIKTDDGQEIIWPIDKLSESANEGQIVKLFIGTSKDEEKEREKIAKTILNDILKTDDDT